MRTSRPKSDPHPPMHFENALHMMPRCIGGYDHATHKTIADLRHLVALQMELRMDGEDSDIKTREELAECVEFLRKTRDE